LSVAALVVGSSSRFAPGVSAGVTVVVEFWILLFAAAVTSAVEMEPGEPLPPPEGVPATRWRWDRRNGG